MLKYLLTKFTLFLIRLYQVIISPLLGGSGKCLHQPSCSHYGKEAIKVHGIFYGSWLTFKRILSCNPSCICGVNPVPHNFNHQKVKKNESN